jgi:microcystin-dependent protein
MVSRCKVLLLFVVLLTLLACLPASAQDQFVGEIRYVAFNFAPKGWALCDGQLLPINQNQALFTLLGTSFGGDGKTTFALPDMRGRVPVGTGEGLGLTNRNLGDQGGQESVTLTIAQMPMHRHNLMASTATANTTAPGGDALANSSTTPVYSTGTTNVAMKSTSVNTAGKNQPHENMQPFLGMTCIIALQGIFPSQN